MLNKIIKLFKKGSFFIVIFAVLFFNFATGLVYAQFSNIYYTDNQLSITTTNATNITSSSATLNSSGLNMSNSYATTWFEYGAYYNLNYSTPRNSYGFGYFTHSYNISALNPNTNYYFRAVTQDSQEIIYGTITPFKTNQNIVNNNNQVISSELRTNTNPATKISSTSAQLNGLITNRGATPSNTYFEWGTDFSLINKTKVISTGAFPVVKHINKISGLTPNTSYYFRVVTEDNFSRSVGETVYFTTSIFTGNTSKKSVNTKNDATILPVESGEQSRSLLSANILSADFLPGSLFDWLLLIILTLIFILLVRCSLPPTVVKKESIE